MNVGGGEVSRLAEGWVGEYNYKILDTIMLLSHA